MLVCMIIFLISISCNVFKYINKEAPGGPSPVRSALLKDTTFKVKAKDSGITLDEFMQGAILMELKIGDSIWCMTATDLRKDEVGLFVARKQGTKPASCLPFSPSGAFLD